ncbi:MAG: NADH-quinone oxidoreductase subunit NuoH [Candidatus Sumerlaeaceae bacterium]|nr:NADH-quinone oxidoreductase subunit NuoH [Candidatus Sumerlaeaceae bacterium]
MNTPPGPLPVAHPNHFGSAIGVAQEWLAHPRSIFGVTVWPGWQIPDALALPVGFLAAAGLVLALISLVAMVMIYLERKVAGHIQSRLGPMRVGWHGILQSVADGLKLLVKEDIIPDNANRFLFSLAPALVMVGAFVPFAALPFADGLVFANMDIGLFYILGFASLEVIGVIMAGWASGSKWSLFGGMRLAAQMMSYEIPLGLSVLTVAIMAGSLNLSEITRAQATLPFVLQSPFAFMGFFVFYIAALANTKRAPFDLPEAESELVSGFHTEYSGMRFAFFFLAEYAAMALVSAVGSILFLGGWNFPFSGEGRPLVGLLQLGLKTFALLFMMLWLRWTLPRVRIDQVMYLCLKVLLPMGMFCLLGAGFQAVAGMALPLWGAVLALAAVTYLIGRRSPSSAPAA